jgi:hypothetical protein
MRRMMPHVTIPFAPGFRLRRAEERVYRDVRQVETTLDAKRPSRRYLAEAAIGTLLAAVAAGALLWFFG